MSYKVCTLYAGIGGNRKLWTDCEVTAVEINPEIAAIYKDFFPDDNMIIGDAHQYLLDHFKEFDFIWSSPPCQTHSRLSLLNINLKNTKHQYPDMRLYQEIIFLKHRFRGKYVVENVNGYYKPLIVPQKSGRHYFWSNFQIPDIKTNHISIRGNAGDTIQKRMDDIDIQVLDWHGYKTHKEQLIKNCVIPKIGKLIFDRARDIQIEENVPQGKLF